MFVTTDWEEFRGLSSVIEEQAPPPYLIMDGRRMIPDFSDLTSRNYTYLAVGAMAMGPTPCDAEVLVPLRQSA